ncbi:hypothetical protein REH65_21355 [Saccharopolyspora sp. ID03-671]|uniref:hypothetical protein n=1 Tax=Saccharopolyspora sp. ID03-671 TaxID=3073066 RepID=UPI00324A2F42
MAEAAIADIGVSAQLAACTSAAGGRRAGAFRGYASSRHRKPVISGVAHSLLVRSTAASARAAHLGRSRRSSKPEVAGQPS